MSLTRRQTLALGALAATGLAGRARAQAFEQPKFLYGFPAGSAGDIVCRRVAEKVAGTAYAKNAAIVENKPGAGGMLGANELVTAAPDGYTLSQLPHGVFRIPHMQKTAFDTLRDFTWIACLTGYTFGLVVPADGPIKNVADFVAWAKANPGKLSYGSTGIGTSPHLAVEEFAAQAGIQLNHVPFKGNADNMQAILGGHTMAASDATGWAPHVDSGRLRLIATYGSKRTKRWPHVPTLAELGYKTVSDSPFGVCGPKGMDAAVTRTLHDAFRKTLEDPEVLAVFDKFDQSVIYMNTEQYTKWARETFEAERATMLRLGLAKAS